MIRKTVRVYDHEHVNVHVDVLVNVDVDVLVVVDGFWRIRSRSASFEGAETVNSPALLEDTEYSDDLRTPKNHCTLFMQRGRKVFLLNRLPLLKTLLSSSFPQ